MLSNRLLHSITEFNSNSNQSNFDPYLRRRTSCNINANLVNGSNNQQVTCKKHVYICVIFMKIGEIDTLKEQYSAEVIIKARWREPELDRIEHKDSIQEIESCWSPQLYIENTIGDAKQKLFKTLAIDEFGHAFLCERHHVCGLFFENLELNDFPFDVQDLSVTVASLLSKEEIKLINDPDQPHSINKQSFIDEQEWKLYKNIETSQIEISSELNEYFKKQPALLIQCRAARRPAYFVWNLFLVTFLICSLSLVTFAVDKKYPQNRLQLSFTLVLTLVAFKFVVNQCLPKISYLTYLDKYIIFSMFFLTIVCGWHGFIVLLTNIAFRLQYNLNENLELVVVGIFSSVYGFFNLSFVATIYISACKRRRLMFKLDQEYMDKFHPEAKIKRKRRHLLEQSIDIND